MAAVAAGIGDRVAYLASQFVSMNIMLYDVIAADGNMACLASRFGGAFIAMVRSKTFGAGCMPVQ